MATMAKVGKGNKGKASGKIAGLFGGNAVVKASNPSKNVKSGTSVSKKNTQKNAGKSAAQNASAGSACSTRKNNRVTEKTASPEQREAAAVRAVGQAKRIPNEPVLAREALKRIEANGEKNKNGEKTYLTCEQLREVAAAVYGIKYNRKEEIGIEATNAKKANIRGWLRQHGAHSQVGDSRGGDRTVNAKALATLRRIANKS